MPREGFDRNEFLGLGHINISRKYYDSVGVAPLKDAFAFIAGVYEGLKV